MIARLCRVYTHRQIYIPKLTEFRFYTASKMARPPSSAVVPIQSASDERSYRVITLKNQLQAILVSDPTLEKSAACMDVHVGAMQDPIPGMAHFLEHMLFLGTEKYPDEESYKKFLSEHGGRSNASTSEEHTRYHFDVKSEFMGEALDRFSEMFISPLFTASATDREMKAIQNEFELKLFHDGRRNRYVDKQLIRETGHPFQNFTTGNLETLRNVTREELIDFYKKNYSSSLMKLAVVAKQSLDEIEGIVRSNFTNIPNFDMSPPRYEPVQHPTGRLVRVVPVKDRRILEIQWPIESVYEEWRKNITGGISHCLGHEGPGSILALLKAKGWANGLSSGLLWNYSFTSVFQVSVTLTPEGFERWESVAEVIFSYMNMLRSKCTRDEWIRIYEESQALSDLNFRFISKIQPDSYSSHLANGLHRYGAEHVMSGPFTFDAFDPDLTAQWLARMDARSALIYVRSQDLESKCTTDEKWYGVKHDVETMSDDLVSRLTNAVPTSELDLPPVNEFLPTDLSIIASDSDSEVTQKYPELLREFPEGVLCWHKLDTIFKRPKAVVSLRMLLNEPSESPRSAVLTTLVIRMLCDSLDETTYDASVAGLHYSLGSSQVGISLIFSGYNNKLPHLMKFVLEACRSFDVKSARFADIKDAYKRALENSRLVEPYAQGGMEEGNILSKLGFDFDAKLAVLDP
eukprot:1008556_1